MNKIIQNAVYVISTNKYYISRNRHDYIEFETKNGKEMIDAGLDYFRSSFIHLNNDIEDLRLDSSSPIDDIEEKLLWGSYGKTGKESLKINKIKNLEVDHLRAILDYFKNLPEPVNLNYSLHKNVVKYWLKEKTK